MTTQDCNITFRGDNFDDKGYNLEWSKKIKEQ